MQVLDLLPSASNVITVIGLTLAVLLAVVALLYYVGLPRPIPGIPHNKAAARKFLGDAPDFVEHFQSTGEGWDWFGLQCEKMQSPIVQVFLGPWQRPAVILADQDEIRYITTRRTKEFDRGGFLTRWLSSAVPYGTISMPTHARFKAQRAVWQGTMTTEFINRTYLKHMHKSIQDLIDVWRAKAYAADDRPFEANNDCRLLIFEIIWASAFGEYLDLMRDQLALVHRSPPELLPGEAKFAINPDSEILEAITFLLKTLDDARATPFPSIHHRLLKLTSAYRKADGIKKRTMLHLLEASKKKYDGRTDATVNCAMDHVYQRQAATAEKVQAASEHEMIDELTVFLVGGFESIQQNSSWGMKYLSRHQDVQKRLQAELLAAFPDATPTKMPAAQDIISAKLPYLDAVIEETLRISRTNAGALRVTTQDTQLYGYRIPAGTDILAVHTAESSVVRLTDFKGPCEIKRRNTWEKGSLQVFDPERFLVREGDSVTFDSIAGPVLAFGSGPRSCFGQRHARTAMRMLFTMAFLSFDFLPFEGELASFRAEEKLVRGPVNCYMKLRPRS